MHCAALPRPKMMCCHCMLLLLVLYLKSLLPHAAPATATERATLLDFKSKLTDPSGALTSWTPTGDPCRDFHGVTCGPVSASIERIVLHSTNLSGPLPASPARLPALQILSLFGNRLSGPIPQHFAAILTLRKLNLSSNLLSGPVPSPLGLLPALRLLDLSGNSLSGDIPASLFSFCLRTRFVSLARNRLSGAIPSFSSCSHLVGINLSFNNLTGNLPPHICAPPGMAYVSLRGNSLSGYIDGKLSNCRSLEFVDLGSNSFSGSPPFNLLAFKNLSYFNASANSFAGLIPEIASCGDRVTYIDASGNGMSGEIPPGIANCRELRLLDLGFNSLVGGIPPEIGRLKSLSVLRLGNNSITGDIPAELRGIELLQFLDLQNLQLSGEIPAALSQCQFLLELDASGNGLQGGIPDTLYNMTYLQRLDLHRNRLNGSIPATLGQLSKMEFLDLSENSLTGDIPTTLANITLLTHFNLSYNNLSGAIPSYPIIQQFGPSAFAHNPLLCGQPLNNNCPMSAGTAKWKTRVLSVSAIVAIVAAALIFSGVCLICAVNILAYRKKQRTVGEESILVSESTPPASTGSSLIIGKLVLFSKSLPTKYEDWEAGTKALLDKDCLIGGGSIGTVYRSSFDGGASIAVKKLETLGRIRNQEEFEQEMGRLGNLRHPNLVGFQGYYWSSTMQLTLSEFVSNGNLYEHLHGFRYSGNSNSSRHSGELLWSRRFKIALGTARALAYLHHDCRPQALHLNIKSTNILLDEDYEAKLSDYGLGWLLPILGSYNLSKFHTAIGYVAPELASQSLRYSDKCDVYSFGVVLLEIVTGRKPVDSPGAAEVVVLRDYVRQVLEDGRVSDCIDRRLRGFPENELIQVLKMGLICTSDAPPRRPNMAEVVQFLESVRPGS